MDIHAENVTGLSSVPKSRTLLNLSIVVAEHSVSYRRQPVRVVGDIGSENVDMSNDN